MLEDPKNTLSSRLRRLPCILTKKSGRGGKTYTQLPVFLAVLTIVILAALLLNKKLTAVLLQAKYVENNLVNQSHSIASPIVSAQEGLSCDRSQYWSDVCTLKGDIRVQRPPPSSNPGQPPNVTIILHSVTRTSAVSSFNISSTLMRKNGNQTVLVKGEEKIKPYTRKNDAYCMSSVSEFTLVWEEEVVRAEGSSWEKRQDNVQTDVDRDVNSHGDPEGAVERLRARMHKASGRDWRNLRRERLEEGVSQNKYMELLLEYRKKKEDAGEEREEAKKIENGGVSVCDVEHQVEGVVFSTAGYTGNVFHEFQDILIPLYIMVQHLKGEVVLVVTEFHFWWFEKFGTVARQLSNYPPVLLVEGKVDTRDRILEEDSGFVHCFPKLTVGLAIHADLAIIPSMVPPGEGRDGVSMQGFQTILYKAWNSDPPSTPLFPPLLPSTKKCSEEYVRHFELLKRPAISLFSRNGSRSITNEAEVIALAERLGFHIFKISPSHSISLQNIWHWLQGSQIMLGVHGAAMTHILFMRPNTSFIQIVPLGLDWPAQMFYSDPAERMGLIYTKYLVDIEESSLSKKYPKGHEVLTNPQSVIDKGWLAMRDIYLIGQSVTINLDKMERTLKQSIKDFIHDGVFEKRRADALQAIKECKNEQDPSKNLHVK